MNIKGPHILNETTEQGTRTAVFAHMTFKRRRGRISASLIKVGASGGKMKRDSVERMQE